MVEEKHGKFHIIGKGTYGCVVRPEITRTSNTPGSRKFISKVQEKNEFSQSEMNIGKELQKIPKYQLFFAPILEHYPISLSKITDSSIKDCIDTNTVASNRSSSKKHDLTLVSNKMYYVGKMTFRKFFYSLLVDHALNGRAVKQQANQLSQKHMHRYMSKLVDTHLYLLHSLTLLNGRGLLHLDIKENNVIYNKENDVFIMIDFGLGVQVADLEPTVYAKTSTKPFSILSEKYFVWPIEMVFMSYIARQVLVSQTNRTVDEAKFSSKIPEDCLQEMKKYCTLYLSNNRTLQMAIIDERDRKNFETRLHAWTATFKNKTWKEIWQIVLASHKSWDHYGLSVMVLTELTNTGLIRAFLEFQKSNKQSTHLEIRAEEKPSVWTNIMPMLQKKDVFKVSELEKNDFLFLNQYVQSMKEIILADPSKRKTPEETISLLKSIFQHLDKQSYMRALEQLNRHLSKQDHVEKIREAKLRETLKDLTEEEELHKQANKVLPKKR